MGLCKLLEIVGKVGAKGHGRVGMYTLVVLKEVSGPALYWPVLLHCFTGTSVLTHALYSVVRQFIVSNGM